MSIFKKEVVPLEKEVESPKKEISVADYYGNIEIDLLEADDKIIKFSDVTPSDFSLMFTEHFHALLTKTQYSDDRVGTITDLTDSTNYFETTISDGFLLAPVLKFEKPLKEIFKNTQKDDKGRDIVYFSEYPIEAVSDVEKDDIIMKSEETDKSIHYAVHTFSVYEHYNNYIFYEHPVITYNNAEYIEVRTKTTLISSEVLRIKNYVDYSKDYVIKLKPIKWLCDYENNRLVCLDGLISGIPYNKVNVKVPFNQSTVYDFLKNCLLPDIKQFLEVPKLEEVKNEEIKSNDIEIKDNILNMLRELLNKAKLIIDMNDKILIVEDIKALANLYGREMLKIKNKEVSVYGSTERELIRNGILPYYVYIEGEINREINEDNKEQEYKEIQEVINKLKERANLINDVEVKNDVMLQIFKLNQEYLNELFKGKVSYQRIDFNKPLEKVKTNTGEIKLTFVPPRPVLIKELVEKEIAISRRIDREISNNSFRNELSDFEEFANDVVKR